LSSNEYDQFYVIKL